jgi:hypothetical protein
MHNIKYDARTVCMILYLLSDGVAWCERRSAIRGNMYTVIPRVATICLVPYSCLFLEAERFHSRSLPHSQYCVLYSVYCTLYGSVRLCTALYGSWLL